VSLLAAAAIALVAAASDVSARKELIDAAKANDLHRFDTAIEEAQNVIESMRVGARRNAFRRAILIATDMSRVWHFEVQTGALYYDDERLPFYYDRLASEYREYPKFIAQYQVIDASGLPQYPTRETRAFLLRLLENNARKSP
jgi:hypothetical protein